MTTAITAGFDLETLYAMIAGESSATIAKLAPHIAAISDAMAESMAEWLTTLDDDADADAVRAIVAPGVLAIRCDGDYDDDRQGGYLYRIATYHLTLDGDDTGVSWTRTAVGYQVSGHNSPHIPGTYLNECDDNSERAPEWVRSLVADADDYPAITDEEIAGAKKESLVEALGEEPEEDEADGEWAVIGMDAVEHGRYATEADCHAAIAWESARFSASPHSMGGAYLPRSVCHLPCGVARCGQWSTSYYSHGCAHAADRGD